MLDIPTNRKQYNVRIDDKRQKKLEDIAAHLKVLPTTAANYIIAGGIDREYEEIENGAGHGLSPSKESGLRELLKPKFPNDQLDSIIKDIRNILAKE